MTAFPKGFSTFAEYNRFKQHVTWGDPLIAVKADVAALVTSLGGNSAVSAIYDIRLGLTVTAGKITQWDDARGSSGFGPSLVPFSTSPGPAYDSVALTATFSAGGGTLSSASTFSIFDPSVNSIAFVGTVGSASANKVCGIGSATQNINLLASTSADFWGGVNGTARSADSGVTNSTRRLVMAAMVGGALKVEAPNHIAVNATAGAPTSVSGNVTLGAETGSTTGATGVVRAFLVLAGAYSTGQRDTLGSWAVTSHSAVLA